MELIDISKLIGPDLPMPPGVPAPTSSAVCDIGPDSPSRVTRLENWTTHLATHVDVPRHFLVDGATVDTIDLARFQGPATVVRVARRAVLPADVPDVPPGHNILFATAGGLDGSYIDPAAVLVLLARKPNLVGIDSGGVDRAGDDECPAHHGLLGANILRSKASTSPTSGQAPTPSGRSPSASPTATAPPSAPFSSGTDPSSLAARVQISTAQNADSVLRADERRPRAACT